MPRHWDRSTVGAARHAHMEVTLYVAVSRLRSRLSLMLVAVAAVTAAAALLLTTSAPAPAETNPSNMLCKGSITKGSADPDDPASGVVNYTFACSGPLTGYSLVLNRAANHYETEIFATDVKTKEVIPTDAFSCTGDIPGFGVNCTGTYGGNWNPISGAYSIDGTVCREPRPHPQLIATYATKNSAGNVQQYIAGPFDLGRPKKSCAHSSKKKAHKKATKNGKKAATKAATRS
jgi:hypothetical protein